MPAYGLDLKWRAKMDGRIVCDAKLFLSAKKLVVFAHIDSETDALPIGELREI